MDRSVVLSKRRVVTWVSLGLVVVAAVAAFGVLRLRPQSDPRIPGLPLPERGEVIAEMLAGGWPVFVVHDLDGAVVVIAAESTHLEGNVMAWCPSRRTIEDVDHGTVWDAQGRYIAGPGRSDLARWRPSDEGGDALRIWTKQQPEGRSVGITANGPRCASEEFLIHPYYDER